MSDIRKIIAVDFDGTLCENKYPEIGEPNLRLIRWLNDQQGPGDVDIILWTCRVDKDLTDAINFCNSYGLFFNYVNENTKETKEGFGTDPRKIFAHYYIDDRNFWIPMFHIPYRGSHANPVVLDGMNLGTIK